MEEFEEDEWWIVQKDDGVTFLVGFDNEFDEEMILDNRERARDMNG